MADAHRFTGDDALLYEGLCLVERFAWDLGEQGPTTCPACRAEPNPALGMHKPTCVIAAWRTAARAKLGIPQLHEAVDTFEAPPT